MSADGEPKKLTKKTYERELAKLQQEMDHKQTVIELQGFTPEVSRLHNKTVVDIGPPTEDDYLYRVVEAIENVAAQAEKTVPQVALNWLLQRPTVSTLIIGARNEEQLRQNLGAVGWSLTKDQVARLDAASAVAPIYPYWHQRVTFIERNAPPTI